MDFVQAAHSLCHNICHMLVCVCAGLMPWKHWLFGVRGAEIQWGCSEGLWARAASQRAGSGVSSVMVKETRQSAAPARMAPV